MVTVLVPGAVFHLYAACKNIDQEEILERPIYTVFYIISVLLRIILEVIAFWLQSHLFGFQVGGDASLASLKEPSLDAFGSSVEA